MTVPTQFIPRNYDVFAGLDVDKRSMAVIFTDHQLTGRETSYQAFKSYG